MEKKSSVYILLTAEFIVFTILALALDKMAWANSAPLFILLILLLFTSVILTAHLLLTKSCQEKEKITEQLHAARKKNVELEEQYEQSTQSRVFDLQVANAALNREIAERIQAEEEIRELQKQQTLILDSAGEGILGLDKRGRVTFMNQAASHMLGWQPEELLGHTHHSRIHHTTRDGSPNPEEECPIYQAYKDGKVHHKTGDIFWRKDGSQFLVEYVSTPIEDRGMLSGAVVVFRDIDHK